MHAQHPQHTNPRRLDESAEKYEGDQKEETGETSL
jgi:hypothetical protein